MLYCKKCQVKISTATTHCPLCFGNVEKIDDNPVTLSYPKYIKPVYRYFTWSRLLTFFSLFSIFLLTLINILTYDGVLWCIIAISCILYIWLAGLLTFKVKERWGLKIIVHSIAISILLIIINVIISTEGEHPVSWAVAYGMPIISITFIVLITILMLVKRHTKREFLFHLLILCIIGFIPLILVMFDLVKPITLSIISASLSYATILGLMIFANRLVETEIKRKFHL